MEVYPKLRGETARDYALRVLTGNIISLDLKPGTAISENELASELGISRTPVREAIIELAKAYLIEHVRLSMKRESQFLKITFLFRSFIFQRE